MNKKVLITGGSGLIGQGLTKLLHESGWEVAHLSRNEGSDFPYVRVHQWNPAGGAIDDAAVRDADIIVHLAGANLAGARWTKQRKRVLVDSRIQSAHLLYDAVERNNTPLEAFISASGISFYGQQTTNRVFEEDDPAGSDFLGQLCIGWEAAADRFIGRCRVAKLRTPAVLDKEQGALPEIARPVSMGAGSPLGTGKQWMPWVHVEDIMRMYFHLITQDIHGPYNANAPEHVTNGQMTETLARVLGKPYWAPRVPAFALRAVYGEMADVLLRGSRASSTKIRNTGFDFQYGRLEQALRTLYDK